MDPHNQRRSGVSISIMRQISSLRRRSDNMLYPAEHAFGYSAVRGLGRMDKMRDGKVETAACLPAGSHAVIRLFGGIEPSTIPLRGQFRSSDPTKTASYG